MPAKKKKYIYMITKLKMASDEDTYFTNVCVSDEFNWYSV